MAQASKTTETIVKAVEEERVTLVLTSEEAEALITLLHRGVNGSQAGPRGLVGAVSIALRRAGVLPSYGIRVSNIATLEREDGE